MIVGKKPRGRGAIYPYEFVVRLTPEMGERMNQVLNEDSTKTKVGLVRAALEKFLPKKKASKETAK